MEKHTTTPLPTERTFIIGIYSEKKRLVVRKFEEIAGIKVCLDEQYALNEDDAIIIMNILFHEIHSFTLN